MNSIIMNLKNSKTSDTGRSLLNLNNKIDLKQNDKVYCLIKSQHLLCMEKYKKAT